MKNKKDYPFLASFVAAAAAIIIFLPLRVYQYFKILEPETGFYAKKDFSVYLMYAVMAFIVVFSIVISLVNRKKLKAMPTGLSPVGGAVIYGIAAIGMIADAAVCVSDFLEIYSSYEYNFDNTLMQYISQKGGNILAAQAVFAIVSAVYFFTLAGGSAAKKNIAPSVKIIALAAPLWAVMRLLARFKRTISFINVSDLLIELFAIVFVMLFLYVFAQNVSKVDKGENYWKLFAYGIPAAVFSLACFVPRAVLLIIGRGDLLPNGYGIQICDFTLAIMILSVLMSQAHTNAKGNKKNPVA